LLLIFLMYTSVFLIMIAVANSTETIFPYSTTLFKYKTKCCFFALQLSIYSMLLPSYHTCNLSLCYQACWCGKCSHVVICHTTRCAMLTSSTLCARRTAASPSPPRLRRGSTRSCWSVGIRWELLLCNENNVSTEHLKWCPMLRRLWESMLHQTHVLIDPNDIVNYNVM